MANSAEGTRSRTTMTSIVENIKHYQKSIDRSLNDESRLLHCIAKLYRLPVSVQHLQETGIGRTVNGLRKYDGEVGVAAKALVSKWKSMVAAEESEDGGDQQGSAAGGNHYDDHHQQQQHQEDGDEDDDDNYDDSRLQVDEQPQEDENDSDQEDMHEDESPRQEVVQRQQEEEESDEEAETISKHTSEEHRKSSSSKSRDHHEKESRNHHSSSSSKSHSSSSSSKKSSSERDKKDKHKSSSDRKSSSQSSEKESSHSSSSREKSSSSKHHSSTKVSSKDSNGYKKEDGSSKRGRSEEVDELNSSKKVKREESSEKSSSDKNKSSSRSSKSSSSSSSSSKDRSKKSSSDKKRESSSKEKSGSDDEVEGLDSSAGASFADALAMIGMPSSSSSKKKSSSDKPKKSPSSSMPPPAAKVRSEKSSHSSSSKSSSSRHKESSSPKSTASSSGYSSSSSASTAAPLLRRNVELDPLPEASEIVESLPIISPHYKPMPLNQTVMGCVFGNNGKPQKSHLTEEEALGHSMQSKNQRTKVYSGVKTHNGVVPSLFDSCIRMLQENIDLLDVTGGVPFDLLKPVLERASPEQLMNLEHYNPYLMEDSDVLWEQHCKRNFRMHKRKEEECESWREMYMRCSEERDAKLRSLTQNIKMSQAEKVAPVRKTQLAYVDSAVKPPRSVISKQARYGTDRTPVVSPAARVAALKNATSNVAKAGDTRLKVAPGARDTAQAVFQPMKPKKAPMMTKVMNSIKGIKGFRR